MTLSRDDQSKIQKKLDNREKVFVQDYLIHFNPEKAALTAQYSATTARTKAYQWVSNSKQKPHVFNAIKEALKKRAERTEITQDRVLKEYAKLGFLDPRKFYDDDGNLIPVHKLPGEVAAALTGMDVSTLYEDKVPVGELKKIKFADKKTALDSVAKHLGMFIERKALTDTEGKDILTDILESVRGVTRGLPNRTQKKIRE